MARGEEKTPTAPARGAFHPALETLRGATANAANSKLPQMAAALAFRTIFGLIPVMVVALVALKFFVTEQDITNLMNQALGYAGLNEIRVIEPPAAIKEIPGPDTPPPDPAVVDPVGTPAPVTADDSGSDAAQLNQFLQDLIKRVSTIPWVTISVIGLVTLIYAAMSMLVEVERAFNQIYRVPVGRSWVKRVMQYWTLLTLGPLLLFATFYVGERAKGWAMGLSQFKSFSGDALTVRAAGFAVTVFISTGLLLLAYTSVPNTKVRLKPALAGAFLGAIMWEAGKWGFSQYLHYSRNYALLYGSIALIPLFMLWVYVTWLIVLFGLYIAYQLQHVRQRTLAQPQTDIGPTIVDPSLILALMAELARRFDGGQPADAPALARALGIAEPIAVQMAGRLTEAGYIHRVTHGDREGFYVLSRAPSRITAEEILRLGEDLALPRTDGVSGEVLATMRRARLEAVRGKDLVAIAALVSGPRPGHPLAAAPVATQTAPSSA